MQGESEKAEENELLGEFILTGLRRAPKGHVEIEVTFEINTDGIVSVSAKDLENGQAQSIQVTAQSGLTPDEILKKRTEMKPIFETMKKEAEEKIQSYSKHSQMFTAYNYFLENYEGLTRFLTNHLIPIDNNQSERLLRSHVVGRKTWYGTHSKRSAESAAVHFTIVESCKMVGVNPREFYKYAVGRIHANEESITPFEYKKWRDANTC
jgi:hypothetical protein